MTSNLYDLWRKREEIRAALDSGLLTDDDPACERFQVLDRAIRAASPTDPAGLAVQMRLLADDFAAIRQVADEKLALRIATALEKLAQARGHGKSDGSVDFARVASGSAVASAEQPPLRLAMIDSAGASGPRRLDHLPGGDKAPEARRLSAEPFVFKAAALVWAINLCVVTARAWWVHRRPAPAGRSAAAVGRRDSRSRACGPSFPRSQRLRYSFSRL